MVARASGFVCQERSAGRPATLEPHHVAGMVVILVLARQLDALAARQLIWVRKRNLPNFRARSLVDLGMS